MKFGNEDYIWNLYKYLSLFDFYNTYSKIVNNNQNRNKSYHNKSVKL